MAEYVITEKARRAVTRLVRGKMAATVPPAPSPAVIGYDQYLAPYTVRWSQAQTNGTGAWVIWLPDTSKLLMYASSYITPGSISPAASLPPGFYTITDLPADATSVWLVVHVPNSGSGRYADFAASAGTAETGETVYNILVATMTTDSETGAKWVKQLVDSAITLGGRGGTQINIDPNGIVAVSMEYTGASYVDPVTEAAHPYAIKMARGHLAIVNGALTVTVDPQITQYIDTVPLSSVLLAT